MGVNMKVVEWNLGDRLVHRKQSGFAWVFMLCAVLALGACDDSPSSEEQQQKQTVLGEDAVMIGMAGGIVQGPDNVMLSVPEGALSQEVTLRISRDSSGAPAVPAGFSVLGSIYKFTPHGAVFNTPAELTIPVDTRALPPDTFPVFMRADPGGEWVQVVQASFDGANMRVPMNGFSYGVIFISEVRAVPPERRTVITKFELASPTGLPLHLNYVSVLNSATTATIRVEFGQEWLAQNCRSTHTVKLRRAIHSPYDDRYRPRMSEYPVIDTKTAYLGQVTFNVPLDASHNGGHWYLGELDCDLNPRFDAWGSWSRTLFFGYVFVKVDIPTPRGAPTISQQPQSVTVVTGNDADFSVAATAPDNLEIQWQRSHDSGASWSNVGSGNSYTLTAAQLSDNGALFRASVCNSLGGIQNCIHSSTASLSVNPAAIAPQFDQQPISQSVVVGQTASFTTVASGVPAPAIQWYQAGTPNQAVGLPCAPGVGNTHCTYTTPPLVSADSGKQFYAVASNSAGNATSNTVTVTVTASAVAPTISATEPADVSTVVGATANFAVNITGGTAPMSYQWYRDGNPIAGANAGSYSLSPVSQADDGSLFWVTVSNGVGMATSRYATLSVRSSTATSIGNWILQQPLPHANPLGALAVYNGTVFAAGERVSQYSSDQGQSWTAAFNGIGDIRDIAVPAAGVVLTASLDVGAGESGVHRSTDMGKTFTQMVNDSVRSIAFADANNGVAVNAYGNYLHQTTIYRTGDGGLTWTPAQVPYVGLNKVVAIAPGTYLMIGGNGLILRSADGGQSWTVTYNSGNTADSLTDVAFANASLGLVVIDGGNTLLRTTDGGNNWSTVAAPAYAYRVAFADASHAVIVSGMGHTYYSTDGGQTWVAGDHLAYSGAEALNWVTFADANTGYVVGSRGQVFRTMDAGLSWALMAGGSDLQDHYEAAVVSPAVALIGNLDTSLRSSDGGYSWATVGGPCHSVVFADDNVAMCSNLSMLSRSDDAGVSWSDVYDQSTTYSRKLAFASATTGVAVGDAGEILRTTDGGQTWSPVNSGVANKLYEVGFVSATKGYAGGRGATDTSVTLLHTTDAGATWSPLTLPVTGYPSTVSAIASPSAGVDLVATYWQIFRSTNGGSSWTIVADLEADSLCKGAVQAIAFTDATHGLAVGSAGCMLRSSDAGITWSRLDLPLTSEFDDVKALDSDTFLVVGDGGLILRNGQDGAP